MNRIDRLRELEEKIRQLEADGDVLGEVSFLKEAVELAKEQYGIGSDRHIELQSEYGGLLKYIGKPEEAVKQLLEVKELLKTRKDRANYITALVNLAGAYRFAGDLEKSETLYLEARELLDKKDYVYASICNNLGILYQDQKRWEEAERLHLESRELLKEDPAYSGEYITTLGNLSAVYLAWGKYERSEKLMIEAEEEVRIAGLTEQTLYASLLNQKASLYYRMGRTLEAIEIFRQAYGICERKLGGSSEACVNIEKNIQFIETSL